MLEEPSLANLTISNYAKPSKTQNPILQQLGQPHVDSFNYMTNYGLKLALKNLAPIEFQLNEHRLKFEIVKIDVLHPQVPPGHVGVRDHKIYPTECRQRAASYKGRLIGKIQWFVDDVEQPHFEKDFGQIPIMIKSNRCNLENLTPHELVEHKEHEQEWGGYFVIKGHERLIRMLLQTRRNYPIAIKRSTWKQKGTLFSECGVSIRCVGEDQISCTNILHFVTDGTVKLMFGYKKLPYYLPLLLVLKCLCDYRDSYIYQKLINGYEDNSYYKESIKTMLLNLIKEDLKTHDDCCRYLGKMFRVKFTELPEWKTDSEICDYLLKNCLLLHLNNNVDKFNLLVIMTQKLFLLLDDKIKVEGADAVMMQELLLGGHLYLQTIKERLHLWLVRLRQLMMKKFTEKAAQFNQNEILLLAKRCGSIESGLDNFFATGNLASPSGLNLMQTSGLTIVCENINRMRYMSHFRAVHRGSFFQEMRTTDVRQLLPDAWGFICPVHTPDGAPCGLLNHLTMDCIITDFIANRRLIKNTPQILANLGMIDKDDILIDYRTCYCCLLDGCLIGYIPESLMDGLVWKLREYKIDNQQIPNTLEIVWIKKKKFATQLPGLYLFTGAARMMRPVLNLRYKKVELIGTFEQVYLDICVNLNEFYENTTTHMELNKTAFLSNLAKLIPMPDCNQSPRNMYQCQMGKQTMGTACHTYNLQSETKLYRLQTPATPLFRPVHYDNIDLDEFAMGTNAIVAVISYTGYDMEDAMIINKSSHDRGFAHGSIYKSEFVELEQDDAYFHRNPDRPELADYLDTDGLPFIGRQIHVHEPYYCYYNTDEGHYTVKLFSGKEDCIVDNVRLCGTFETQPKCVCISFRIQRNPNVGDKFASRAGQKGICSQLWQQEDLPFTETGLVPDIVFNPHGFPSRMTIAMMIELMAGKSAALHGLVHDATPFKFNENDTAIDYFGRCLEAGGYNYYGTETMYSGIDGRQMTVDIFFGVVHYQRLRHMVSDKWQVRSTGPIDILTRQPLKGRRRGGGVRFGEMERDSLISHGVSFLLQDRLFHCSDKVTAFICTSCKTLLGPMTLVTRVADKPHLTSYKEHCRLCGHGHNIEEIQIPYIFKFFVTQLAAININVKITCERI